MAEFSTFLNIKKYSGYILLMVFLIIGIFNFKNYGISADEYLQYNLGKQCYNYVFKNDDTYLKLRNKEYGVAVQLGSYIITDKILRLSSLRSIFLARHFIFHLFFLFGALACYSLVQLLYNNRLLASIAFLLIVLNPRLYAHSFFNPKDIPFLAMLLICLWLTALAFSRGKIFFHILLGIATGLLINIRIMGIMLLVFIMLIYVRDLLIHQDRKRKSIILLGFLATISLTLILTWPFLWEDPVNRFLYALKSMAWYHWDGSNLFFGRVITPANLNWYYFPTWFLISNPLPYLVLGITGCGYLIYQFYLNPVKFISGDKERNHLLYFVVFLAPILATIILGSHLYNGWRHMYFVYAPFVMLMIFGLNALGNSKFKKPIYVLLISSILFTGYFMIRIAPYQQVYFNILMRNYPAEYLRKNIDLDYWGLSYKQGLDCILKTDTSRLIKVAEPYYSKGVTLNVFLLSDEDQRRIRVTHLNQADYFLSNYHYHVFDYHEFAGKEYYRVRVMNNTLLSVFKLKPD